MRIGAIWKRWIEVLATLFLSWRDSGRERRSLIVTRENEHVVVRRAEPTRDAMLRDAQAGNILARSEEHTSELQSRGHLVCRLLLEKKKIMALVGPQTDLVVTSASESWHGVRVIDCA